MCCVNGWDGELFTDDFPDELDRDDDKLVYRITFDTEEVIYDQAEYDAWAQELMRDSEKIEISYRPMTQEAIAELAGAVTKELIQN